MMSWQTLIFIQMLGLGLGFWGLWSTQKPKEFKVFTSLVGLFALGLVSASLLSEDLKLIKSLIFSFYWAHLGLLFQIRKQGSSL
jgi:hypothetical protein